MEATGRKLFVSEETKSGSPFDQAATSQVSAELAAPEVNGPAVCSSNQERRVNKRVPTLGRIQADPSRGQGRDLLQHTAFGNVKQ